MAQTQGEWELIEANVDSGAVDHVANKRVANQFPIRATEMSLKGAYYEAATGTPIWNEGEKDVTRDS